jgi:hypothetical protein
MQYVAPSAQCATLPPGVNLRAYEMLGAHAGM